MANPLIALVQLQLQLTHECLKLAGGIADVFARNRKSLVRAMIPVPVALPVRIRGRRSTR